MVIMFVWTYYFVPWMKARTDNEKMHAIIDWAIQAVLAAEQVHTSQTGAQRKYIVTQFLKKILEQKNIAISDEELDIIIEAAVKSMNGDKVHATVGQEKGEENDMETRPGV